MGRGVVIIPDVPQGLESAHTGFMRAIKQALEVLLGTHARAGSDLKAVTKADMQGWFVVLEFLNSWVNYGGLYEDCGYCKDALGFVHIRGLLKSGVLGQPAFQLPIGFRPYGDLMFPSVQSTGSIVIGWVLVKPNGNVMVGGGGNTYATLDGIVFYAK